MGTVEQYLSSTGKTADSVRAEYKTLASKTSPGFALEAISEKEQVVATDEEVTKIIQGAKTGRAEEYGGSTVLSDEPYPSAKTLDKLMA